MSDLRVVIVHAIDIMGYALLLVSKDIPTYIGV